MAYCEDYPCCGHTPQDPCERQWYDEPDAFDTRKNPHALCNHEEGECNVEPDDEEDDEYPNNLPLHRTEANYGIKCSTCDGGGCPDCTDPA